MSAFNCLRYALHSKRGDGGSVRVFFLFQKKMYREHSIRYLQHLPEEVAERRNSHNNV